MFRRGVAIVLSAVLLVSCIGSSEHELDGSVLIYNERNFVSAGNACQGTGQLFDLVAGNPIKITPKGHDPIFTKPAQGEITPEGNCRLSFHPKLPEAETYIFEVAGREPVTRQQFQIDGSNGSSDGWWVTLAWDSN